MIRVLTANQMKESDKFTIENLGIPSEVLIERAGEALFSEITSRFKGGRVLIVVGKGNNGNDGLTLGKLLSKIHGFAVSIFDIKKPDFALFDKKYDIIVDCLFGIGLSRNVEGIYKEIVDKINATKSFIISCDIPSGLNADNGLVMNACVNANMTICIQELKTGLLLNDGIDKTGEVIVKDVGISVWEEDFANLVTAEDVAPTFCKRNRNVNKGTFGKTAIIGGSKDFVGSSLLSVNALTALKMGVGYSYLCIPESLYNVYAGKNPECIIKTIKDKDGFILFDKDFLDSILKFDSIAIGMGIGVSLDVYKTIEYLLNNYTGRLLIDADGLNTLSKFGVNVLKNKKCQVVLTPHIGEFARLIEIDKTKIIKNPIEFAKDFAKEYDLTLVLKSCTTIIADRDLVAINTTGNSSLAKGGSGDVLSGIIGGLLTRDRTVLECAYSGCYIFGLSADISVKEQNEYTVTATDVINALPKAINSL